LSRIAVLWDELPAYAVACLRALGAREGVELLVVRHANRGDKAFDKSARSLPVPIHTVSVQEPSRQQWPELRALLADFQPDVALVSGWAIPLFNRAARFVRRRGGRVICMSDNQWRGDMKQIMGAIYARVLFWHRYSAMFVPGERARPLGLSFGFSGRRLIMGSYTCDWSMFSQQYYQRDRSGSWPTSFLIVGNVDDNKGIPYILQAYVAYRAQVSRPWDLEVAGQGPLLGMLQNVPGVTALGFLQPRECARVMSEAGALILGSFHEQWGVVIHEATAAGLPVICTRQCGGSADLVFDGANGFTYDAGDISRLTHLMAVMSTMRTAEIQEMSRMSFALSLRFTPDQWCERLLGALRDMQ
jgi:glycosyltransferase involved in cell wall biosynthesis